jgi:hypothetical protein
MESTRRPNVEGIMKATRLLSLVSVLALSSVLTGCIVHTDEDADDSTLLVVNRSDYAIFELNLVDVGSGTWGRNYVGAEGLYPDEDILLVDIECDYYDARLIDEDDNVCEIYDIDLCFDDATWRITNNTCDIFAAKGDKDTITPQ